MNDQTVRRGLRLALVLLVVGRSVAFSTSEPTQNAKSSTAFRIVVIEGEDAVNIIQQKTAIAPVVEVRDENDLPIAGVPVTFTMMGKNAAFGGGVQAVSVTTNAAGRAAVASLNPLGSGAVHINVTASYQGQTLTATISQTNFATTAAAAQAGAPAGSGATTSAASAAVGAGGAGGIGAGAIGAIAGGIGAGVFVASKAAGGGGDGGGSSSGGSDGGSGGGGGGGAQNCTFSVSPTSVTADSSGGTRSITISPQPSGCRAGEWTANSMTNFVSLNQTSGAGGGGVTLTIEPNQPFSNARSGSVSIAGQTVTVEQSQGCQFIVSPTTVGPLPGSGGSIAVTINPSPSGCTPSPWTTQNDAPGTFITLTPTSGIGGTTVTVSVTPNPSPLTGRTGAVVIGRQVVTVTQNPGS